MTTITSTRTVTWKPLKPTSKSHPDTFVDVYANYSDDIISSVLTLLDAPLPADWKPICCEETRYIYYLNERTKEESWTNPLWPLPPGWVEKKDSKGCSLFFKKPTTLSHSNKPLNITKEDEVSYPDPRGDLAAKIFSYTTVPFPKNYTLRVDSHGYVFYVDNETKAISWSDPRNPLPVSWSQKRVKSADAGFLPLVSTHLTLSSNPIAMTSGPEDPNNHELSPESTCNTEELQAYYEKYKPRLHTFPSLYYCIHMPTARTVCDPRRPLPSGWRVKLESRGLYYVNDELGRIQWFSPLDSLPAGFALIIDKHTKLHRFLYPPKGLRMTIDPRDYFYISISVEVLEALLEYEKTTQRIMKEAKSKQQQQPLMNPSNTIDTSLLSPKAANTIETRNVKYRVDPLTNVLELHFTAPGPPKSSIISKTFTIQHDRDQDPDYNDIISSLFNNSVISSTDEYHDLNIASILQLLPIFQDISSNLLSGTIYVDSSISTEIYKCPYRHIIRRVAERLTRGTHSALGSLANSIAPSVLPSTQISTRVSAQASALTSHRNSGLNTPSKRLPSPVKSERKRLATKDKAIESTWSSPSRTLPVAATSQPLALPPSIRRIALKEADKTSTARKLKAQHPISDTSLAARDDTISSSSGTSSNLTEKPKRAMPSGLMPAQAPVGKSLPPPIHSSLAAKPQKLTAFTTSQPPNSSHIPRPQNLARPVSITSAPATTPVARQLKPNKTTANPVPETTYNPKQFKDPTPEGITKPSERKSLTACTPTNAANIASEHQKLSPQAPPRTQIKIHK